MRILALILLAGIGSTSFAASRYYYDVQKFQAILDSKDCASALGKSTLDGIELTSINEANRTINYTLKTENGKCTVDVVLTYDDGFDPNYRVTSVGPKVCN